MVWLSSLESFICPSCPSPLSSARKLPSAVVRHESCCLPAIQPFFSSEETAVGDRAF